MTALQTLVEMLLDEGVERGRIVEALQVHIEEGDAVLDVLDQLAGWVSPHNLLRQDRPSEDVL